jgi:nucleotide-binding universal stress UspA family protein
MSSAPRTIAQPKFQSVLFTTDFSPCSQSALPYARAIGEQYGSTIHVVHVVSTGAVVIGGEFGGAGIELERENETTAHQRMDHLLQSTPFKDVPYTQTIQTGVLCEVLLNLVADLKVDLIVTGTHGRRGMAHFLLGSVAEQIFRRATCPVLTVGPEVRKGGLADGALKTIVYATDFSPASIHAFEYALSLARDYNASLHMLHAVNSNEVTPDHLVIAISEAQSRLSNLILEGVPHTTTVAYRHPADMILDVSRGASADLIIVGAHRDRPASTHMPCAVAHRVVSHAPCPVLTVRG